MKRLDAKTSDLFILEKHIGIIPISVYYICGGDYMNYMSTKEASKKWNITDRRIRVLLNENRIDGAVKVGRNWMIPSDITKPIDLRAKRNSNFLGLDLDFKEVDRLKKIIDSKRPLDKNTVLSLKENVILSWTYNSNAIEGSTLTLSETKVVLEGITIGGKSVIEHLEVINHKEAILFLDSLVEDDMALSEWDIKTIHAIILKNIDDEFAGRYRMSNVIISGASHVPPRYEQLDPLMEEMIYDYNNVWTKYHPIVQAALLHGEFVKIHPFVDGNGRTARLLLNLVLIKNGYPPVIIKKEDRLEYYESLDLAHTKKEYSKFINLIVKLVNEISSHWISLI